MYFLWLVLCFTVDTLLSPDKNPGVKNIQERFARLGVISQILRSPEKRGRYDVCHFVHIQPGSLTYRSSQFFYKNGVPKWRGTGYYYSRYRPTLLHTLIFLTFLTSLLHYLVQALNYNRDIKRVNYFEESAKRLAGKKVMEDGGKGRRKVRVDMVEGSERGGSLELVVKGDGVFLVC
jgi:DnaJ family protein C protein 1